MSHDFAIKLLKYVTYCVRFTAHAVRDGFFLYLVQMITSMRGCVACNDISPRPISSRSFSHDFAMKVLKYGTSCRVCSRANTVVYGFILYLIQMTTSIRGCVTCYEIWPRPIYSRSICREFAIKLLNMTYLVMSALHLVLFWINSFRIWHKWSLAWEGVSHTLTVDLDL